MKLAGVKRRRHRCSCENLESVGFCTLTYHAIGAPSQSINPATALDVKMPTTIPIGVPNMATA
jgi:hypothetical protein